MYLLRLVDSNTPCLGKVYYTCALVGKHLAILSPRAQWIATMKEFFVKRWARWHHPIHTLAYAMDPSYQAHVLSAREQQECKQMITRLRPDVSTSLMIELNCFKSEPANFRPDEWKAVDIHHAYQWWDTFGSVLPVLQSLAVDVLSKPASASACEFNWSLVSSIERKGRLALNPATTNSVTNIAAMYKLEQQLDRRGVNRCLPSLESVIELIVSDEEDGAPLLDVVDLAEVVACESDDDEEEDACISNAAVFSNAEAGLYADWSSRDGMLQ